MKQQERREDNIVANKDASIPILAELSQAGFEIQWISDLYNKRFNYKSAIPILIRWLPQIENPDIKETIVRALSVPWAKHTSAQRLLVEEFHKLGPEFNLGLKWAIGNALSVVADDDVLIEITELIQDEAHGKAREMLVVSLGNMKSPHIVNFLIELLNDKDLDGYAIKALGKLKAVKARPMVESFLIHEKGWVQKEAKKALARIDKAPH